MTKLGAREIVRNPSVLRIGKDEAIQIEDKKKHQLLGVYIGTELAEDFFRYLKKRKLLQSAQKIKNNALKEYYDLEATVDDAL